MITNGRAGRIPGGRGWRATRWLLLWPLTLISIWVAVAAPVILPQIQMLAGVANAIPQALVALAAALLVGWLPVYWLLRTAFRRPIPKRIALLASWLLLVPLLPELLQSATNALRGLVLQQGYSPYLLPQHLDSLVWLVLIVAGGSVVLRTLIIRTLDVGGPGRAAVAPSNRLPGWVAAVLILAALPIHAKLDQPVDLTVFENFFTTSRISRPYSCPSSWRRSWRRSTLKAPSRSSRKRSPSAPFSLVSFSVAARPTSCWCRFPCCWAFFCLPAS